MNAPTTFLLILIVTLLGCNGSTPEEQQQTSEATAAPAATMRTKGTTAANYFEPSTLKQLEALKSEFDRGLAKGYGDRLMGYVYEQHAIRMRLDLLNNEPYTSVFPYNEKYDLSDKESIANQIPFLTKKCGFQNEETGRIVNYYCFSLEGGYFDYLEELGKSSELIEYFRQDYLKLKTIGPDARYKMVMDAQDQLDFKNLDHQLFYFLFHMLVNEERLAGNKINEKVG